MGGDRLSLQDIINMKIISKIPPSLAWVLAFTATVVLPGIVQAATNNATNLAGGTTTLTSSGMVTVTSTPLTLVKAVFDTVGGTCLASDDLDPACNSTASVSVPAGRSLKFLIYVNNSTGVSATDVRFQDLLDDVGFTYAVGSLKWGTRASAGATKSNIFTVADGGTALTDAFDGSTGSNEYAGINTAVSPDNLTVGGNAVSPDNDTVNIAAGTVFAIVFIAVKN